MFRIGRIVIAFALGALRLLFPTDEPRQASRPKRETLPEKIKRWKLQAAEFERMGRKELARDCREAVKTYERHLRLESFKDAA